jgi:DNA-directed RNA polymerase subunit RPC12/RpoP
MDQPLTVSIAGRPLRCPHCQNDTFYERSWQLNTSGMTFFNLDWLNSSATNYVCSQCGRIEWFTEPPGTETIAHSADGDTECLECGDMIPHGVTACPKCDWTYTTKHS